VTRGATMIVAIPAPPAIVHPRNRPRLHGMAVRAVLLVPSIGNSYR
jgi:hypothetical protein